MPKPATAPEFKFGQTLHGAECLGHCGMQGRASRLQGLFTQPILLSRMRLGIRREELIQTR